MPKNVLIPFRHSNKVQPYADAVEACGMRAITMHVDSPRTLDGINGLLLMGGTDVNPIRYNADRRPETDTPDDVRDQVELELIETALAKELPILGICRGLQLLNVYHGGTLIQHLSSGGRHDAEPANRGAAVHEVTIEEQSRLYGIAGVSKWRVNSRHHQAADRIGNGLRISARDTDDGVVEALEREDGRFVVAVQWHPEDQIRQFPEQLKLFRHFGDSL